MSNTSPNKFSECTDPCCFTLINPHPIKLYPNKVNEIVITQHFMFNDCKVMTLPELGTLVLLVQHHNTNSTWRILTNTIFLSSLNDNFVVPIVTDKETELAEDELIDHVHCISIEDYLTCQKGTDICRHIN